MNERPDPEPPSVFEPRFRRLLFEGDEPATAGEVEWAGPWRVERIGDSWGVLRRWEHRDLGHKPEALFHERLWAELCALLLPGVGRSFGLSLGTEKQGPGFPILAQTPRGSEIRGWLRHWITEIPDAFQTAEALRLSPVALAHLLLSIGPTGLEQVGQILARQIALGDPP